MSHSVFGLDQLVTNLNLAGDVERKMASRRLPSFLMVSCATRRLGVGARAGGRMEDECVGSGGDRAVSGRQQRQGGLAWPAVTGQVHSGGGRRLQALGRGGERLSCWCRGSQPFIEY